MSNHFDLNTYGGKEMNDYSKLSELDQHFEHIKTMEEANAFCQAYGEALEKYAMDLKSDMVL